MNTTLRTSKSKHHIEIKLIEGDITLSDAEAITNPANSQLLHGGGLAGQLSRKGGPAFQKESTHWVKEKGPVSHRSPAYTTAGELPFKFVIHAVGPVWGSGNEADKLREAVLGSLHLAEELELQSLALPAISTGVFRYPVEEAAQVILAAARDFRSGKDNPTLKQIQIVVFGSEPASIFQRVWDQTLL